MSLYEATTGKADSKKFTGSMRAVDLALLRLIGAGVASGLVVSAAGVVSAGEALIGHVVALAAPINALPLCAHSATNYVYLAMPPAPACVGLDGRDVGVLKVNQSGAAPESAILLGVIVTNAAGAVVSVDPAPAGRRDLAVPFSAPPGGGGVGSGAAGTITIRTVTTGDPGTAVKVVNVGTASAAVLDITIPRGLTGVQGDPGRQGNAGLTPRGAYDPALAYAVGDFVYDGSAASTGSFIALQASTGATLVDGANWRLAQPPGQRGPAGPAFFKPHGPYDPAVPYAVGDVVSANRASYAAVQASTGQPVSNGAYWQLLLDAAPAGLAATITGVEIRTLPAGSDPTVSNTGTDTAAHLVFGIPAGGSGAAATGPATQAAFGTVKTDIAEDGGSVIYTKTTADNLFTTKAALAASKGAANGLATLDGNGQVPTSQLPASVLGGVEYQGVWDAAANSPALASGAGTTGRYYKVSASGNTALDGNSGWHVGDWAVFDGVAWEKIDNYEAVTTVAGKIGNVTLVAADITDLGTAAKANLPAVGANAAPAQVVRGDDTRLGACVRYCKSQFCYATLPSGTVTDPIADILPALPAGITWLPTRASVATATAGTGNTFQATAGGTSLLTAALGAGAGVQTTTAVSGTGIAGGSVVSAITTAGSTAGTNLTFSVEWKTSGMI